MKRLLLYLTACLAAAHGAAPLAVEPPAIDLGVQGQGLHVESEVRLTNRGDRELHLLHVTSDCSCVAGEPRHRSLAPGASTVLPIGFDTRNYQGPLVRRLVIHTSAGEAEVLVRATIRAFARWEVVPFPANLPPSQRRQEVATEIRVTHDGPGDFAARSVSSDQAWLHVSLAPGDAPRTTRVLLRKLSTAPVGSHLAQLVVRTDDPQEPQLPLKVFVPVVSPARVTPNPVILPTTRVGASATREVVVSAWDESSAPLARLASGRVEARGRQPNGDYVFVVTVPAERPGMHTQPLELGLDEGDALLTVPVILKVEP